MIVLSGFTGKLPKNYNSEVDPDPERWIPKRERTYYKGKRQKKGASVGKWSVAYCSIEFSVNAASKVAAVTSSDMIANVK